MNFIYVNSVIAVLFLFHRGFAYQPCPEENNEDFIMFADLQDFVRQKAKFFKGTPNFNGSRVIFANLKERTLEKNSFTCETCEYIANLVIYSFTLEEIGNGAFDNLKCLRNLDFRFNDIMKITPKTFAQLANLETLAMWGNKLSILEDSTFANNEHLRLLDMSYNQISHIEDRAFFNLLSLERLLLDGNKLIHINFEIFRHLPKLSNLYISYNRIERIEPSKTPSPNIIEEFDVSLNRLTEGLEKFYFPKMSFVNISKNRLRTLDVETLKINWPKLDSIGMADNLWECSKLPNILESLNKSKIEFEETINCIPETEPGHGIFYYFVISYIIIQALWLPIFIIGYLRYRYKMKSPIKRVHHIPQQPRNFENIELQPEQQDEHRQLQPQAIISIRPITEEEEVEEEEDTYV